MSDTVAVRYVGPSTEGVTVPYEGDEFECPRGEWVELPAALVNGTPHTYADGYEPGERIESEYIVEYGRGGLAEQDAWEVRRPAPRPSRSTSDKNDAE